MGVANYMLGTQESGMLFLAGMPVELHCQQITSSDTGTSVSNLKICME